MPLIYALCHAPEDERQVIQAAIKQRSADALPDILQIVHSCGALDYTHTAALQEADKAQQCLRQLPQGPFVDALTLLTEYSTARLF